MTALNFHAAHQPNPVYSASPIKKRARRTKANIAIIRDAILDILSEDNPQTVRQVFYALTVRGLIKKIEGEYQQTVIRLLVDMREAAVIPFDWIADNTR
jgi:DNA topoisomerase VI subunit A